MRSSLPRAAVLPAVTAGLLLLAASSAGARGADPVEEAIACSRLTEAAERLACYDRTVPRLRNSGSSAAPGPAPSAPSLTTAPPVAAAPTGSAADRFGGERISEPESRPEQLSQIAALVRSVRTTPTNRLIMELDNGQIWVQKENARLPLRVGDPIIIEQGILGSYDLRTERANRLFKVERVR